MQWGALTVTSQVTTLHVTRFYSSCAKEATRLCKRVFISLMSQGQYRTRHAALQRLQWYRMPGVAALTFCSSQLVLCSQWFTAARSSNEQALCVHMLDKLRRSASHRSLRLSRPNRPAAVQPRLDGPRNPTSWSSVVNPFLIKLWGPYLIRFYGFIV